MSASAPKQWDTAYEFKIILILSLAFGLVGLDRFILPVLFPSMMEELGLSQTQLGTLAGMAPLCYAQSYLAEGLLAAFPSLVYPLVAACVVYAIVVVWVGVTLVRRAGER